MRERRREVCQKYSHAYKHRKQPFPYSGVTQNLTAGSLLYTVYDVLQHTCPQASPHFGITVVDNSLVVVYAV